MVSSGVDMAIEKIVMANAFCLCFWFMAWHFIRKFLLNRFPTLHPWYNDITEAEKYRVLCVYSAMIYNVLISGIVIWGFYENYTGYPSNFEYVVWIFIGWSYNTHMPFFDYLYGSLTLDCCVCQKWRKHFHHWKLVTVWSTYSIISTYNDFAELVFLVRWFALWVVVIGFFTWPCKFFYIKTQFILDEEERNVRRTRLQFWHTCARMFKWWIAWNMIPTIYVFARWDSLHNPIMLTAAIALFSWPDCTAGTFALIWNNYRRSQLEAMEFMGHLQKGAELSVSTTEIQEYTASSSLTYRNYELYTANQV